MKAILPMRRSEWMRFAFWVLETAVVMLTVRDAALRLPSLHGEHFADSFYFAFGAAALALAVVCFCIRRSHPALATIGWITLGLAFVFSGIQMPVY